jgi:hypothetical protein
MLTLSCTAVFADSMSDRIRIFEVILKGRGRKWVLKAAGRPQATRPIERFSCYCSLRHIDLGFRLARSAEDYSLPDRQARINPMTPFRPFTPASGEVSSAIATRWDFGQA